MNCEEANRLVDALLDQELSPDVRERVESHLASCPFCQSLVWETEEFRAFFKFHAPKYQAPLSLRAKILAATQRRSSDRLFRSWRPVWAYAAAALFMGLAACLTILLPDRGMEFSKQAVADCAKRVSANHLVETTSADSRSLRSWFAARLGFTPPSIDLRPLGYQLEGGRIAVIGNQSVVTIVYSNRNKNRVTIFCWPPSSDPVGYTNHELEGHRVCTWSNASCSYILVSEENDPKINAFVDSFRDQGQPSPATY